MEADNDAAKNRGNCCKITLGIIVGALVIGLVAAIPFIIMKSPLNNIGGVVSPTDDRERKNASDVSVIVVGAGIAGLTAARNLAKAGVNVILLEGATRAGGRVHSVQFGGVTINPGAPWIYGRWDNPKLNPVMELTKDLHLTGRYDNSDDYIFRDSNGADVTQQADDYYDDIFSSVVEQVNDYALTVPRDLEHSITIRNMLDRLSWWPRSAVQYAMEWWQYDFEFGDLPENANLRSNLRHSTDEFGDSTFFTSDERGMALISDELLGQVKQYKNLKIYMNDSVTEVTYTDDGVTVKTRSGATYTSGYAIITVSIGVLQRKVIKFSPPLPKWKIDAVYRARMSQNTQVFLKFNDNITPFWDEAENILYCSEVRGYYPLIINLNKGFYGKNPNMLLFSATQQESLRVEGLSDEQVMAELIGVLRNMYNATIPEADDIYVSRWSRDPLHYGAFNLWAPSLGLSHFKNLMRPVGKVYFAGEAYHPLFYGYMHSAYITAEQQVKNILTDL